MTTKPVRPDLEKLRERTKRANWAGRQYEVLWLLDMLEEAAEIIEIVWPQDDGAEWLKKYRGESDE